jgi:MarR family transcriptional regulator, transcriptional regulator for hemolysin
VARSIKRKPQARPAISDDVTHKALSRRPTEILKINQTDPGVFLFRMTRVSRHWRRQLDLELKHYSLTEATCRPLIYINRMGDGVRQKDLAYEMEIEGSSLVRLIDSLEQGGLVTRRVEREDRRANNLYLTAAGQELLGKLRSITDILHRKILAHISPRDEAACLRTFAALERAFLIEGEAEPEGDGGE